MQESLDQSLGELVPIKELSDAAQARLAATASAEILAPGAKLKAGERLDRLLYLLVGSLGLVSRGKASRVTSGSARARMPLFADRLTNEFAVAETECVLLNVDRQALGELLDRERTEGFEVTDVELNADEGRIFREIYDATINNRLELPTMPEVALSIQRMADDPDVGIRELMQVIQTDGTVAGALLHAVNSPLFRGAQAITNIRDAVVRLGLKTTSMLATNIAMRQAFHGKSPLIKRRMGELWEHSVNVSAIAYVLARRTRKLEPDRALLAGLMHDIGVIPILRHMEEQGLEPSADAMESTISRLHAMTGVLVMSYWGMDAEMVTVVEEADNWMRDAADTPDYCDLVIVSQLLSYRDTPRMATLPRPDQTPAFRKLDLGRLDEDMNPAIIQEAREELDAIKHILSA
jgi:HD-like signal output (HDOD) protein